jgi:hypothetical protein
MMFLEWLVIGEEKTKTTSLLDLDQGISNVLSLGIRGLTRGSVDNTSSFFIGVEERPTIFSSVLNLCRFAHW